MFEARDAASGWLEAAALLSVREVDDLDLRGCADALHGMVVAERAVAARKLAPAAHWADVNDFDPKSGRRGDRFRARGPIGAEGTPEVAADALDELAVCSRSPRRPQPTFSGTRWRSGTGCRRSGRR